MAESKNAAQKKWWEVWKSGSTDAKNEISPDVISPIKVLLEQPYGTVLPMLTRFSGKIVTAFVIHESEERVVELAQEIKISTIVAFMEMGSGVYLCVTLFKLGDQIFENWWNWHSPDIRPLFNNLFEQKEFIVGFVSNDLEITHVKSYQSTLKNDLLAKRSKLTSTRPWTMHEFDEARAAVEKLYPTLSALWEACGGK